ncbi:MAG TPA: PBP1A family penicillin-binding protein, partial [Vicinamibacterales bacterium]|nr:PBP1A family penicillin-binding protein [Vicinamibacterales bacterium]
MITGSRALRDRVAGVLYVALIVLTVIAVTWLLRQGYAVHRLTRGVGDTWFLAADGRRWFRMDEHRRDVPLADIPEHLQHAFIAVEDHRFYAHPGVDPIALGRAVVTNLRSPGTVEGGSTLTQQLARTLFLSNKKTYGRKAREAVLAMMIDAQLSKDQVLELYLNRIYLSAGVYGVETMSRHLFGRPAKQLNLAECALIAGLARAPATLSPWSNLDGAIARSHVVLARMREEGFITAAQEREAHNTTIRVRPYPGATDPRGGYAKEYLRQLFRERFGGDHPPEWEVRTTFVPALQDAAEQAVRGGLSRFSQPDLQAALVAIDPRSGDILAVVGGRDFAESQFNRAARSRRQPGSAFKPLLFAAALEHGYSPVSTIHGLASIAPQGPDEWAPRNVDGNTPDVLTLRAALLESNNRAATALQQQLGSRPVLRLASHVGLHDMPDVPSLSLGTGLVTPLELTAAFAAFPNGGSAVTPRAIVRVLDADGGVAMDTPIQTERVLSAQTAFQIVSMLADVVDRGTGVAVRRAGIGFPVGGKTGTTNDFKDAWFVGFSSNLVVGVWVGFDQPRTIGREAYGSRYAAPLWADFMRRAARTRVPAAFDVPSGLKEVTLCRVSYARPVEGCPTYTEYLKPDDEAPGRL